MTDTPHLPLTRREELPAAVAYLLGYHPTAGSLAALVVKDGRVVTIAGLDATRHHGTPSALHGVAAQLADLAGTHHAELILLFYGTTAQTDAAVASVLAVLRAHGVQLTDVLRVDGARLHCLLCHDCAPGGMAFDISTARFSAAATYLGKVAHPNRTALAAQYAPITGVPRTQMDAAIQRALTRATSLLPIDPKATTQAASAIYWAGVAVVDEALHLTSHNETLDDDAAAWLLVLLHHLPVRDYGWLHGTTDHAHLPLWANVTRRARTDLAAPPACLLAIGALRQGDGILANIAIDRALAADPAYQLTSLLMQVAALGLPPSELHDVLHPSDPAL